MKVNKEEVLGMYVALEKYINQDHDKEWKMWEAQVATITDAVKKVAGVITEVTVPPIANHTPKITVSWDQTKVKATPAAIRKSLQDGSPSIETMGGPDSIDITVFMLKKGEEKIVAKRLQEELSKVADLS